MDRAIYTAMSAANAALNRRAVTSNNLANSSTAGFRAQLAAFRSVPMKGETLRTRRAGGGVHPVSRHHHGADYPYRAQPDVALPQDGWLAVALDDGSEGYTRNGAMDVDQDGRSASTAVR